GRGCRRLLSGQVRYGSSPRVRGEGLEVVREFNTPRFIPACAGRGTRRDRRDRGCPVHPRVCGERTSRFASRSCGTGSSPRVRGEGRRAQLMARSTRFIPACAGRGGTCCRSARVRTVHPRVCGERTTFTFLAKENVGSSPRVRGEVKSPLL